MTHKQQRIARKKVKKQAREFIWVARFNAGGATLRYFRQGEMEKKAAA